MRTYAEPFSIWGFNTCRNSGDAAGKMHNSEWATSNPAEAYRVLHDYCTNYEISFVADDIRQQKSAEEIWRERFGDDPIWH